jgi:FdhD protein
VKGGHIQRLTMNGIHPLGYQLYENQRWQAVDGAITEEVLLCIHVNGKELATFMCTPHDPDELALGFLRSEGIIQNLDEVRLLTVSASGTCVDIWLNRSDFELPRRRIITSGCGGGMTFDDLTSRQTPLNTHATITPQQVFERMRDLYQAGSLYRVTQGIHTSALSDGQRLVLVAEDVGRHNTIDRLWGKAMKQGIPTKGLILLATGRISSEMLAKAAKMQVPIVASRTSATSLSIALARAWNITVIGYVRRNSLRVYTAPQRCLEAVEVSFVPG